MDASSFDPECAVLEMPARVVDLVKQDSGLVAILEDGRSVLVSDWFNPTTTN